MLIVILTICIVGLLYCDRDVKNLRYHELYEKARLNTDGNFIKFKCPECLNIYNEPVIPGFKPVKLCGCKLPEDFVDMVEV